MRATALLRVVVMKTAANLAEARFTARNTLGLGLPPVLAGTGGVIAADEAGLGAEGVTAAGLGAGTLASMVGVGRHGLMSGREGRRAAGHARDSNALKGRDPGLSVLHRNKAHEHASNSAGHALRAVQHGTVALPQFVAGAALGTDAALSAAFDTDGVLTSNPPKGPVSQGEVGDVIDRRIEKGLPHKPTLGERWDQLKETTKGLGDDLGKVRAALPSVTLDDVAAGMKRGEKVLGGVNTALDGVKSVVSKLPGASAKPEAAASAKPADGGVAPSQEAKKEEAPPAPGADTKGPPASEKAPFFSRKAWTDAGWTPGRVAGVGGAVGATALLAYLLSKNERGPKKRRIKPEGRALLAGALAS